MKTEESTDSKGRRKVVATNDPGYPLTMRVEIVDHGFDENLKGRTWADRTADYRGGVRVLMVLAGAAWKAWRAGVPVPAPMPTGKPQPDADADTGDAWYAPSPSSMVIVGPNAAAAAEVA